MLDPTLSDDALRKLIAEAGEILDARRKTDLASLIRGMTPELRSEGASFAPVQDRALSNIS
jgi:hypothetical protein